MNLNYESDYKGTPVYVVDMRRANRNFIYALGHQGTSEKLNLIFWDGNHWRQLGAVNATGNDKPDSRPIYRFGRTEDWLTEMKKPMVNSSEFTKLLENVKAINVEEIILSAGIDKYIQEQLNRDWLSQDL